jgi:hypothetical protein
MSDIELNHVPDEVIRGDYDFFLVQYDLGLPNMDPVGDDDPIAKWVAKLNRIAAQLGEIEYISHPSSWHEQTADLRAKYAKLAKAGS